MLVASDDPLVRYEGRVAHGPLGASFDWPLTAVSIRFRCDGPGAVSALLDGAANRFSVTLTTDDHMDPPSPNSPNWALAIPQLAQLGLGYPPTHPTVFEYTGSKGLQGKRVAVGSQTGFLSL